MQRIAAVVAGTVVVLMAPALPAAAKGAESVTISGPGLDEAIEISREVEVDDRSIEWHDLATASGLFDAMWDEPGRSAVSKRPAGELGPRYVATYDWFVGQDETVPIRQRLYPFADGGAVSFVRAGQPLTDGHETDGGWYRAGDALAELLVELGVPRRER